MNNKKIVVDISETGDVSIEGEGFVGPECEVFANEISTILGVKKVFTKKKEYSIKTNVKQKERN
jgi:hypothetical protein